MHALAQPFHFYDLVACFTHLVIKQYGRILTVRRLNVVHLYLIQSLFTAGSLFRFRSVGRESRNELFQFGYLVFGLFVLVATLFECQLAALVPEGIVTSVYVDLRKVDIRNVRTYRIQEVTIMRYYKYYLIIVGQEVFQPDHCFQVQVIGRLIEQ